MRATKPRRGERRYDDVEERDAGGVSVVGGEEGRTSGGGRTVHAEEARRAPIGLRDPGRPVAEAAPRRRRARLGLLAVLLVAVAVAAAAAGARAAAEGDGGDAVEPAHRRCAAMRCGARCAVGRRALMRRRELGRDEREIRGMGVYGCAGCDAILRFGRGGEVEMLYM